MVRRAFSKLIASVGLNLAVSVFGDNSLKFRTKKLNYKETNFYETYKYIYQITWEMGHKDKITEHGTHTKLRSRDGEKAYELLSSGYIDIPKAQIEYINKHST